MKTVSAEMAKCGTLCHCWRLVLQLEPSATSGSPRKAYGFTDHDEAITFGGLTYQAASGFTASAIENGLGLKIDNLEVEGALSSDLLKSEAIHKGLFDSAEIYIYRVNWQNSDQRVLLRRGNIGEIRQTAWGFSAELRGLAHQLSYPQGRLYQHFCDANFGDQRCKKSLGDYRHEVTVSAVSQDYRVISATGLAQFKTGWFAHGKLVFLTGKNKDVSFDIRDHIQDDQAEDRQGKLELWQSPTQAVAIGDKISVVTGCDKSFNTCRVKFSNHLNFQGFPHIPGNDYVQYYPRG